MRGPNRALSFAPRMAAKPGKSAAALPCFPLLSNGAFRRGLRHTTFDGSKRTHTSRDDCLWPSKRERSSAVTTSGLPGRSGRLTVPETRISCRSTSPRPIDYIRQLATAISRAATAATHGNASRRSYSTDTSGVSPSIRPMRITSSFRQPPPRGTQAGLKGSRQTEGTESRAGPGGCGETRPRNRARSNGRHPGFQTCNAPGLSERKCGAGLYCIHRRSQELCGVAGSRTLACHVPRPQPLRIDLRKGANSVLPLADRAIGNLQQSLIGTYHGVSRDQLQVYFDEFVFRHNRRRQPMAAFQTLLGLGTGRKPTAYQQIRGSTDLSGPFNQDPIPTY